MIHNNLADTRKVLNRLVYEKGGWTLHMLRGVVGTEKFWAGIQDYYRRYRDGSASTADFRRVMEENCHRELSWFFDQWLNRPGSPVLEGSWEFLPDEKRIAIDLAQVQSGDPYRLPLEVGITSEGTSELRIEKLEMTERSKHFDIRAEKAPSSVTLDPNCWILMKAVWKPKSASR